MRCSRRRKLGDSGRDLREGLLMALPSKGGNIGGLLAEVVEGERTEPGDSGWRGA